MITIESHHKAGYKSLCRIEGVSKEPEYILLGHGIYKITSMSYANRWIYIEQTSVINLNKDGLGYSVMAIMDDKVMLVDFGMYTLDYQSRK